VQTRQKLRTRLTAEAVVAGVIGPPHAPTVLLLGRYDPDGHLQLAGRTTKLSPTTRTAVAAVLEPHTGPDHPWPQVLPSTRWGRPAHPPSTPGSTRPPLSRSPSTPPSNSIAGGTRPASFASCCTPACSACYIGTGSRAQDRRLLRVC
jgi:hypothetical protein